MNADSAPLQPNGGLSVDTPITPAVGLRLWKREGMTSQAHPTTLSLVVQTLGGELPQWAVPSDTKEEQCDAEFVIVRGAFLSHLADCIPLQGLHAFSPETRVIISSTSVAAALDRSVGLPWTNLHIRARDADLDLIGEALTTVLSGNLLIGLDWADLLNTAGLNCSSAGAGSAVVTEGIHNSSLVPTLHTALSNFEGDDLDGGLLLMQLVSEEDAMMFTLEGLDAFAAQVLAPVNKRDCLLTAALDISRSAVVLIAFKSSTQSRPS